MRILLVGLVLLGFVLLDVVVFLAITNMAGWTLIPTSTLFWMLPLAVVALIGGIVGLRSHYKPTSKG